jgi:hypothetical protein
MKVNRLINLLTPLCGMLISVGCMASAKEESCTHNWEHPVAQQTVMRGMNMSMEEYANNERHFLIRRDNHVLDIYFLQDAMLIKGPTSNEIEHYSEEELAWFPMAFAIPNAVLSNMSPKGPCSLKSKTLFSQRLTGAVGFGPHKLTFAEGKIEPNGHSTYSYSFAATVTPPLEGVSSIQYSGSMRFARKAKPLSANTNVTGYTLVGVAHPLPVVGDASLRLSTVGELRSLLARLEPQDQDEEDGAGEIIKQ